jgi:hypothetical protein
VSGVNATTDPRLALERARRRLEAAAYGGPEWDAARESVDELERQVVLGDLSGDQARRGTKPVAERVWAALPRRAGRLLDEGG